MAEVGQVSVRIGANVEPLQKGLETASRALDTFDQRAAKIAEALSRAGDTLNRRVTLPLSVLGGVALKTGGDFQALRLALESQASSAEEAGRQLERLRAIAREPGLTFEGAVLGATRLQAVGFAAQASERLLAGLANANAGSGGSTEDFNELVRQLTQVRSLGRLTAENLNVIVERSPLVAKALQEAFGTSNAERIRESGVSIEEFFAGLQRGLDSLPRAQGGILNSLSNLAEDLRLSLAPLGETIAQVVVPPIQTLVGLATRLSNAFAALPDPLRQALVGVAGLAAVLGPLLGALALAIKLVPLVGTLFAAAFGSPIQLAVSGVGVLSGAFAPLATRLAAFATRLPLVGTALGALAGPLGALRTLVVGLLAPILGSTAGIIAFAAAAAIVIANWQPIVAFLRENLPRAFGAATDGAEGATTGIQQALQRLRAIVQPALEAVAGFWRVHGEQIVAFIDRSLEILILTVGGALRILSETVALALNLLSGNWQGAWDSIRIIGATAAERLVDIVGRLGASILRLSASIARSVPGIGEAMAAGFTSAAGVVESETAKLVGSLRRAATEIQQFRDQRRYGRIEVSGLGFNDLFPDAATQGGGTVPVPTVDTSGIDAATEKVETLADRLARVREALQAALSGIETRLKDGLLTPLEAATERVDAFGEAYEAALEANAGRATSTSRNLLAATKDAEAAVVRLRQVSEGTIVDFRPATRTTEDFKEALRTAGVQFDALTGPQRLAYLRSLERVMDRIRRGAESIRTIEIRPVKFADTYDAELAVKRLRQQLAAFIRDQPEAARSLTVVFGSVQQAYDALRNGVRVIGEGLRDSLGSAVGAFLGSIGIGMADTRDRIAEIQELLASGDLGAERAAELTEEMERLRDTLNPIKAGFRALGDVVASVMQRVITDVLAAIAKLALLRIATAIIGGGTGGVGGAILTALGGVSATPVIPAATPQAPAIALGIRQGVPRINSGRQVLEVPFDIVPQLQSAGQNAYALSGLGSPFAGGVVTSGG